MQKRAGGVAQMEQCLPSKTEALISNTGSAEKERINQKLFLIKLRVF
jgi:hypothetical protein